MSRIGKLPIQVPAGVTVTFQDGVVACKAVRRCVKAHLEVVQVDASSFLLRGVGAEHYAGELVQIPLEVGHVRAVEFVHKGLRICGVEVEPQGVGAGDDRCASGYDSRLHANVFAVAVEVVLRIERGFKLMHVHALKHRFVGRIDNADRVKAHREIEVGDNGVRAEVEFVAKGHEREGRRAGGKPEVGIAQGADGHPFLGKTGKAVHHTDADVFYWQLGHIRVKFLIVRNKIPTKAIARLNTRLAAQK